MIKPDQQSTLPPQEAEKAAYKASLKELRDALFKLQNVFYADNRYSLLIVLQGLDTSGKDGVIRHALSSMNPQGVQVKAFKKPTEEELRHDFLWRIYPQLPAKGMIKVFNRSYYEDVLVPAAHKSLPEEVLQHRYRLISQLEEHLILNHTHILKFFLNISPEEQLKRIDERKHQAHKRWKYTKEDELIPGMWQDYARAYEKVFEWCNEVPWHIIPADKRWYRNFRVAEVVHEKLQQLDLQYPQQQ